MTTLFSPRGDKNQVVANSEADKLRADKISTFWFVQFGSQNKDNLVLWNKFIQVWNREYGSFIQLDDSLQVCICVCVLCVLF